MKVTLELEGLDGNAFAILGAFTKAAKMQNIPKEDIDAVIEKAMSGDYNHLIQTIMENIESP